MDPGCTFSIKEVKFVWSFKKSEINFAWPTLSFSKSLHVGNDEWVISFYVDRDRLTRTTDNYFSVSLENHSEVPKTLAHVELSLSSKSHTTDVNFDHEFSKGEMKRAFPRFAPKNLYIDENGALLEEVNLTCTVSDFLPICLVSDVSITQTLGRYLPTYTTKSWQGQCI